MPVWKTASAGRGAGDGWDGTSRPPRVPPAEASEPRTRPKPPRRQRHESAPAPVPRQGAERGGGCPRTGPLPCWRRSPGSGRPPTSAAVPDLVPVRPRPAALTDFTGGGGPGGPEGAAAQYRPVLQHQASHGGSTCAPAAPRRLPSEAHAAQRRRREDPGRGRAGPAPAAGRGRATAGRHAATPPQHTWFTGRPAGGAAAAAGERARRLHRLQRPGAQNRGRGGRAERGQQRPPQTETRA